MRWGPRLGSNVFDLIGSSDLASKPTLLPNSNSTSTTTKQLSLPTPPVNTAPSSSLTSPHKIGPASYGLQPRPGSVYCDNQEADTSVDINQLVLQPAVPSYMYSNESPAKHEKRRRTRAQKQLRSKLGFGIWSSNSSFESQQRRHGALFSKITFSKAEFSKEHYIYSPGGQCSDLTADESPKDAGFVPFFAIPATRHSECTQMDTETHPSASNVQSAKSAKPMPTLPGWEEDLADLLAQEDNPFWTEDCTTEPENMEDSVPLGHHSGVLPSAARISFVDRQSRVSFPRPGSEFHPNPNEPPVAPFQPAHQATSSMSRSILALIKPFMILQPSSTKSKPLKVDTEVLSGRASSPASSDKQSASGMRRPTVVPASGSSGGCPCGKRSAPKRHLIDPAIIASRADFQYWNAILDGRQLP
ncbi:hypothetical protein PGT21_009682 [Puccinia graminis f. sp. tritici]|uniref:Uncharacterized protein n=1 Tax=Puccinia graminis f. sp. tritici TaxID=56615 RepID=A0A5B0NU11_PUCGR|nr:hypothetical protein PGT21_009682 [Puccinia graminis f. sp. tritici]